MMFTPKRVPSTSFTVSETPLSATEPLGAMNGANSAGRLEHEPDAVAVRRAFRDHAGQSVDMTGHQMAAELVAESQRALEIDAASPVSNAQRGAGGGLVGDVDLEHGAAIGAFLDGRSP